MCVFFGSLGWPFLYLKLWTKYGFIVLAFFLAPTGCSAALMVVAEDQTHISSRGILQQPKVFVLDETFFVSKILTGCCFMPPSLSLLLRSNLLHLSFDLFIEQKNIFQLLYQRLTRRNWLVRVAASAHFLYSLNRKKKLKLDPTSRSTIQNKLVVNRPKVQGI